jgi:hypothetical protein
MIAHSSSRFLKFLGYLSPLFSTVGSTALVGLLVVFLPDVVLPRQVYVRTALAQCISVVFVEDCP